MQNPVECNDNNFMNELYALLSEEQTCDDTLCLISNLPLEQKPVTLVCGHKFNYDSIFNEIKYQKNPNHLETQKLYRSELKCPYCRTVQKGLLPSRENFQNIDGVNWPKKYQYKANRCKYVYMSGKRKGTECGKKCFDKYCDGHGKIIESREAKKALKQKQKQEKLQNKIISTPCNHILTRGKNKGLHCQCKLYKEGYCKRHYKQYCIIQHQPINQKPPENIIIQTSSTIMTI